MYKRVKALKPGAEFPAVCHKESLCHFANPCTEAQAKNGLIGIMNKLDISEIIERTC